MGKAFDLDGTLVQHKTPSDGSVPDIAELLGTVENCPCGKPHSCTISRVVIRNGALNELPSMTEAYRNILLVCDGNTYRVAGHRVENLLEGKIDGRLIYPGESFVVPNETAVADLTACVTAKTDLIVGVGSGVINDLCKYVAHEQNLPYFIVATAPSMDGYASKGAAMIFDSMKITTGATVPAAIVCDTEILKNAPIDMLRAGYGDIIGKFSCLNDWRLSGVVNDEPVCEYIYKLTYDTVKSVADQGRAIAAREEGAVADLMRALVIVGIAMAYMGNSRPASGSEHHLSHYFEVVGLLRGEPYFCHGIDVAYSTYLTAKLRQEILAIDTPEARQFDYADWEENIRRVYSVPGNTTAAEGIVALQRKLGWITEDKTETYRSKWVEIRAVLADSPAPEEIARMLADVGLPIQEFYDMYDEDKIADALRYGKDLKDRYTVLWLAEQVQ